MFKELAQDETKYKRFWDMFGKYLKIGIIEDDMNNKEELAKLCRFWSSKSGDKPTTLEKYVSNMKEDQKSVYYITGESREVAAKSPSLEKIKKLGYEVCYPVVISRIRSKPLTGPLPNRPGG